MVTLPQLLLSLKQTVSTFPDKRTGKNIKYEFENVALGAFSAFFTQSPSFLAHQELMQKSQGVNNAASLFGVIHIPTDNQIRDLLDEVEAERVSPVFDYCFNQLLKHGYLDQFRQENGEYLVALDGTEYFSSEKIHCSSCSFKEHKAGVKTYSHSMITPVIVTPNLNQIIPLSPEYITPQDGNQKQDCENRACKRWIKDQGKKLLSHLQGVDPNSKVTILGDDLYSKQPVIEKFLASGFGYILVAKEESHPYLYQWVKDLEVGEKEDQKHELKVRHWTGKSHEITTYTWASNVPLKEGKDAAWVNWCEITTIREETGKQLYHNAFVTNQQISETNVPTIINQGRARWKIENENNNTLKTKGYHLEHNFGHGKKHLSKLLASFTLLAFLFHTVMELSDELYQTLRAKIPTRAIFFEHIKALTVYLYFKSWTHLFNFMIEGLKRRHLAPDYGGG